MSYDIPKKHMDRLPDIKARIKCAHDYWSANYQRFHEFKRLAFVSSITEEEKGLFEQQKMPILEFNILRAYISRLRGEFSKQAPSISVSANQGKDVDPEVIQAVEGHMRYILSEAERQGLGYDSYTDTLAGGFAGMRITTEYKGEMSMEQDIKLSHMTDPCMTFYDPMARAYDMSDGEFCGECIPFELEDFKAQYPGVDTGKVSVESKSIGGFQWSWTDPAHSRKYLLVCDYYEKKYKNETIVMLSNGRTFTKKKYDEYMQLWEEEGIIAQPPSIVAKRKTKITTICRYTLIEGQIIEYEETELKKFPLIYIDGDSVYAQTSKGGPTVLRTRPYIYDAIGAQKLKNYAGMNLANELENMIRNQYLIAEGSVSPAYAEAYRNPQMANALVYKQYRNDDPNVPLAPPHIVTRPPIPQEISGAFSMSDAVVQNVLGSFDVSMAKMGEHEYSKVAIQEITALSNATAMPFVVSYLRGLQSAAERIVELMPLYYKMPRTIPIMDAEGNKSYLEINNGKLQLDYDNDAIQVSVEAGVSFGVQQSQALQQITSIMSVSPKFAQFMEEEGLGELLDNVTFRNVETVRGKVDEWVARQKEQQQMAMQQQQKQMQMQANQPNIEQLKMELAARKLESEQIVAQEKADLEERKNRTNALISLGELNVKRKQADIDLVKVLSDRESQDHRFDIDVRNSESSQLNSAIDLALKQETIQQKFKAGESDRLLKFHTAKFTKKRDQMMRQDNENER